MPTTVDLEGECFGIWSWRLVEIDVSRESIHSRLISRWYTSRFQRGPRSAEGPLVLAGHRVCPEPWRLVQMDSGREVAILILRAEHLKHNVLFMTPDICSRSLIQQGRKFG